MCTSWLPRKAPRSPAPNQAGLSIASIAPQLGPACEYKSIIDEEKPTLLDICQYWGLYLFRIASRRGVWPHLFLTPLFAPSSSRTSTTLKFPSKHACGYRILITVAVLLIIFYHEHISLRDDIDFDASIPSTGPYDRRSLKHRYLRRGAGHCEPICVLAIKPQRNFTVHL